ncbi:MAG: hypothetical protein ACI9WO_001061 [Sphingobacteriales bacterium]|jgi:hypothetical protein
MKKNGIIVLVLLVLAGLSAFLVINKNKGTLSGSVNDFAVEDTAAVTRIFIIEKNGENVTLSRENGPWVAQGNVPIEKNQIKLLLETIRAMEIKSPVPTQAEQEVLRDLATKGKKVEIYTNGKKAKTFYMEGTTPDELGTYMLLEGANHPSVVHVPGFYGYLTSRFFTDIVLWKDRSVFSEAPNNIKTIEVSYPDIKGNGFKLEVYNDKFITLSNAKGDTATGDVDGEFLRYYLSAFSNVNMESHNSGLSAFQNDSVLLKGHFAEIDLMTHSGNSINAKLYRKPLSVRNKQQTDQDGNLLPFDSDRMFVDINGSRKLVLAQFFVFDKLLAFYSDFFAKEREELKL